MLLLVQAMSYANFMYTEEKERKSVCVYVWAKTGKKERDNRIMQFRTQSTLLEVARKTSSALHRDDRNMPNNRIKCMNSSR